MLAVVVTMFYWLWRVRIRRSLRGIATVTANELWLFIPVTVQKVAMSLTHLLKADGGAQSLSAIPSTQAIAWW